jgi:hypothetical protein
MGDEMKIDEMKGSEMKAIFIAMDVWNTNIYKMETIYFNYIII